MYVLSLQITNKRRILIPLTPLEQWLPKVNTYTYLIYMSPGCRTEALDSVLKTWDACQHIYADVDVNKSHVNINKSHVDIIMLYVDMIYNACREYMPPYFIILKSFKFHLLDFFNSNKLPTWSHHIWYVNCHNFNIRYLILNDIFMHFSKSDISEFEFDILSVYVVKYRYLSKSIINYRLSL